MGPELHVSYMRDQGKEILLPAEPAQVSSLRVWFCKFKTLSQIQELKGLKTLVVAGFPDETLEIVSVLQNLKYLSVVHLPRITDLSPLAKLTQLESLSLATLPSWDASGKLTQVTSLEPIASIATLKHLELFGVVPRNRSLSALHRCTQLTTARFSKYSESETRQFYAATEVANAHIPTVSFDSLHVHQE